MVAVSAFTALMFDMFEREPNTQETTRRKERLRKKHHFFTITYTLTYDPCLLLHRYYYISQYNFSTRKKGEGMVLVFRRHWRKNSQVEQQHDYGQCV